MPAVVCRICGTSDPSDSRFCSHCGSRYPAALPPVPLGPRYLPLRLQIDPMDPPPRRDVRWTMIVLGIALVIAAGLFLALGAFVGSVLAGPASACGDAGCGSGNPGTWLEWLGLPFLAIGIPVLGIGLWWAVRGPSPAR